jgi:hypothetical protein
MFASITDLYDEVETWADRYDDEFIARLPAFSRLVEQNTYRNLRVPSMEKVAFIDVDKDGRFTIPLDLLEPKTMSFTQWDFTAGNISETTGLFDITNRKVMNRSQENLTTTTAQGSASQSSLSPVAFGRVGTNKYQLTPYARKDLDDGITYTDSVTSETYNSEADKVELIYYSLYPQLSTLNNSNWLLQVAPELYLCGMMYYASMFVRDEEQVGYWRERYESAKTSLQQMADKAEESGGWIQVPGGL